MSAVWRGGQYAMVAAAGLCLVLVFGSLLVLGFPGGVRMAPGKMAFVKAGPYDLQLTTYLDPIIAGFTLPFDLRAEKFIQGQLSYEVTAIPDPTVRATSIRADVKPSGDLGNAVAGSVNLTVRGPWTLHIVVDGPDGFGQADLPIQAESLPAIPEWLGWGLGFVPLYGLAAFFFVQWRQGKKVSQPQT